MPKSRKKSESRQIIYPDLLVEECRGREALTVQQAKDLLGWQEESEGVKFGEDFLFRDRSGKKIRTLNNSLNRPFYSGNCEALVQTHLLRQWQFNGEAIKIGKSGQILDAQHRLISLVLAEQDRTGESAGHWKKLWNSPVTMETIVVKGLDESDNVVNTLDTGRPRSLTDVIYRSEYFAKLPPQSRKDCARILDFAIRTLWQRLWIHLDPHASYRTHTAALDFVERHSHLLKAAQYIWEENKGEKGTKSQKIGRYLGLGYAAGLLYLMGCSSSDGTAYHSQETPTEKRLNWSLWDRACEYWLSLGSGATELRHVGDVVTDLEKEGEGGSTLNPRIGVLVKGWQFFSQHQPVRRGDLDISDCYLTDQYGIPHMEFWPLIGGIDRGKPSEETEEDLAADAGEMGDPVNKKERAERIAQAFREREEREEADRNSEVL